MARGKRQGWRLPAVAIVMLAWQAAAQVPEPGVVPAARIVLQADTDLPGNDLSMIRQTGQEACVQACLATDGCEALTWNARSRACFLKSQPGDPVPFAGAQSGIRVATNEAVLARAGEKLSDAPWISAEDRRQMAEQAGRMATLYPGENGSGLDDLRALAATAADADTRIRWLGASVAASDATEYWAAFATAMDEAAGQPGGDRDYQRRRSAALAALNGWVRDPGAGTAMLRLWARLAEEEGRGRDGLQAIRLAAAADPADTALATEREGFEERHGFRVTGSRADTDGTQPRVCASFSEPLARGIDLRPFVQLPDPALAVEAEGYDLCITGVPRGEVLRFALRAGLPSDQGETLRRSVQQAQYVRDRAPLVRFAGRAYVLPATGDHGLTLTTVNTDRVDLTLYRMSDRNIVQALRDNLFAAPLDDWKADRFADGMGTETWRGQMDVAPSTGGERPVNAEVASRIDLRRAGLDLGPGVYVLNAAVPGQDTDRSPRASQWFMISDMGLTTFQGSDGLTVAVRGLGDAAARPGVEVQLVSRGNAVLGTAVTDAEGFARFDAGLVRGTGAATPGIVTATRRQGEGIADLAFLSLIDPEFDLSDRGVEGAPPAPPINLFVALDRGAYRAGETAHATILARDGRARALDGLPVQARVIRPDGVEHARLSPQPAGAGGHVLDFLIPANAPRGAWRIDLRVEEDGPPLASARMLVEDFRPERIDFDLTLPNGVLAADQPVQVGFDARWLFGAPAADLPVEGELRLSPARSLPGWEGYVFGRHDDASDADVVGMPVGRTDGAGRFDARIDLPPGFQSAARPWEATLVLSVREGAGRPVERRVARILAPGRSALGIRPDFEGGSVGEGATAGFRIVTLGGDLRPVTGDVEWVLNRVQTDYQWFAVSGDWSWEPVTRRSRMDGGTLTTTAEGPAALAVPVDWGSYELVVRTSDGAESSVTFDAGWGAAGAGSDTPDRLRVTLDKPAYRPGETARLTLEAAADGVALVSVMSNRLIFLQSVPVTAGRNEVSLPVTDDWDTGVYVAASAIRPLTGDGGHAPVRALGIAPAAVDPGDRVLSATLTAPAEADPRGSAPVTLSVTGARPGQAVHATVWAVDQGILNLTGYQPPSATSHYFGQRRLGVGLRDLYGRLILPSGAADGMLRSGGDASAMQMQAPPPTERLMAWFSGPLMLDADGHAKVGIPLPDFNGEVRLMAVAWTEGAVGQADASMLVRDPVVVTATVPAFLAPGDRASAQLRLTHAAGPAGDVGLSVGNEAEVALTADLAPGVTLAEGQGADLPLDLTAPDRQGLSQLRLTAGLPDGTAVTKDLSIPVERLDPPVTRAMRLTLAPGQALPLDLSGLGDFRPGTGRVTLSTGAFAALDVGAALAQLAEWPYGCSEQLASAAMPMLYAASLAPEGAPPRPDDARAVDDAIARILTRQTPEGGFGLWSAEPGDRWLDAYVTDFLSRARALGYAVPDAAFRNALSALQNGLNAAPDPQFADPGDNAATAYAAYVLAREGAAVVSDLRYYADTGADHLASPMAAAHLGAALAALGDQGRADALFRRAQALSDQGAEPSTGFRSDYGTLLRDRAGMLALAAEAGSDAVDREGTVAAMSEGIDRAGGRLSTQEAAWIVLAGQALTAGPDAGGGLTLNGAALSAPLQDLGEAGAMPETSLANTGDAPLPVTISATAVPVEAESAGGTAFAITRSYYTPDGEPVDPAQVARGTRLVAVVEVRPFDASGGRLIVTDPLPAGFEIDNPNLLTQGDLGGLDWLEVTEWTDMTEFRQDRFAAALTIQGDQPIRLAYRLRAVTTGDFAHPAATVADMYRPDRRGWTDSDRSVITP